MGRGISNLNFSYNNNVISETIVEVMQMPIWEYISQYGPNIEILDSYKKNRAALIMSTNHSIQDYTEGDSYLSLKQKLALASKETKPTSYYEISIRKNRPPSNPQDVFYHGLDTSPFDDVDVNLPDTNQIRDIFELTEPVIWHIVHLLHEHEMDNGRAFHRTNQCVNNSQEEANVIMRPLKIRDLWNLMPITEHEPIFSFSRKQNHSAIEFRI